MNNRILQAGYWHDIDPEIYERYSYLAVINNEHEVNYAYRDRIVKLKNFVIVHYSADSVLIPKETQSFGFFKPGSLTEILKMKDTDLYKAVCFFLLYIYIYILYIVRSVRIGHYFLLLPHRPLFSGSTGGKNKIIFARDGGKIDLLTYRSVIIYFKCRI